MIGYRTLVFAIVQGYPAGIGVKGAKSIKQRFRANVLLVDTANFSDNREYTHTIELYNNRLESVGVDGATWSFGYDNLGNITSITGTAQGAYSLSYSDLSFPQLATGIQLGSASYDFVYDHAGARMRSDSGDSDERYFVPTGTENQLELDRLGRILRAYAFAGGERIGYKSKPHYGIYLKDRLGSTKMVLNLFAENPVERIVVSAADVDAFGNELRTDSAANAPEERHWFTGQEREDELGLARVGTPVPP